MRRRFFTTWRGAGDGCLWLTCFRLKANSYACIALLLSALIWLAAGASNVWAQYSPIPNSVGANAGQQFRGAVNDRFSGTVATAPRIVSLRFFQLPSTAADGQLYYLTDGAPGIPCSGGGSGALALRARGQWHCSAVASNLQNVRAYGARGDCAALDDGPIQTALDSTPDNGNDGTNPIYLPATQGGNDGIMSKCYRLGKPILLPHGQINLYGDGMEQTYIATNYYGPSIIAGTDHLNLVTRLLPGGGNALDLTSTGFLELTMLLRNLAGHAAFSVEFELNVPASASGSAILGSWFDYPYQGYARHGLSHLGAFSISYDSTNPHFDMSATLSNSGLVNTRSADNSASAGNHALGLYYDGAHLWTCVDGSASSPVSATGTVVQSLWESITLPDQNGNGPITWPDGSGNFSNDSFNGQIDNIRISSVARAGSGGCPPLPAVKFSFDSNTDLLLTFQSCSDGAQYCLENQPGKYAIYAQARNVVGSQAWFPVLGRNGPAFGAARLDLHDMSICGNPDCQGAYIMQSPWSRFERLKSMGDHNGFNFWYLDFEDTFDNLTAQSTLHNGLNAFEWGYVSNTPDLRNLRAEQAFVCFNFESAQTDINASGGHCLVNGETALAAIFNFSTGTWSNFFVDQEGADSNWLSNMYVANLGPNMGTLNFIGGNLDTYGGAPFAIHEGNQLGAINFYGTLFNNFAEDQPAAEIIQFPGLLYSAISGTVWQGQGGIAANATIANAPGTCTGTGSDTNCARFTVPALNFDSGTSGYTTGAFLGNPAFIGTHGSFNPAGTLQNNYFLFTGQTYLSKGANPGAVTHDDGFELSIPGASFDLSKPGTTGAFEDDFVVNAPSAGAYNFIMSYGECCSAPGVLKSGASDLPAAPDTLYNPQISDKGVALSNELGNQHVETFGGGASQLQQLTRAADAYSAFYSLAGTPLPVCNAANNHLRLCSTDASGCTNGTSYTGGGSIACVVNCDGTNWKETGAGCW